MSTRGYGLWLDTTAEATFDFNVSHRSDVLVSVPSERLRIVLFTDPHFPKMLEAFTKLTQRAILPPYWAFAPWMGRDVHQSDAEVREDVERTRALGLPASVILIDSPWATAYNSYTLNPKQFADIPGMVKGIHDAGFKLVLWHTPWINSTSDTPGEPGFADEIERHSPNYDEAAAHGYFVKRPDGTPYVGRWWKGEGALIDFTNPAAKLWWQDQLRQFIDVKGLEGADGFKDDDGEGSYQGDVIFADKTSRELMRNRYSVLDNNAVEEVLQKELEGNGVILARSVSTGANGLGFLWGGDNESNSSVENGLPTVVIAGLDAPMETIPVFAHAGSILPELPPDVMTLVPAAESGSQTIHSMDDRRVYEIVGEDSGRLEIKDFEGRSVVRDGRSLTIDGKAAQVTVRWRFGEAKSVTVNGVATRVVMGDRASSVSFLLKKRVELKW